MTEVAEWCVSPWTLCQDLILWNGAAWRRRQEEKAAEGRGVGEQALFS